MNRKPKKVVKEEEKKGKKGKLKEQAKTKVKTSNRFAGLQ